MKPSIPQYLLVACTTLIFYILIFLESYAIAGNSPLVNGGDDVARNIIKLLVERQCVGCNLQGAVLDYADLRFTNLSKANLDDARLNLATLKGANLQGASLHKTQFKGADLSNADFRGAVTEGADFSGTYLAGTLFGKLPPQETVIAEKPTKDEADGKSLKSDFIAIEPNKAPEVKNLRFLRKAIVD